MAGLLPELEDIKRRLEALEVAVLGTSGSQGSSRKAGGGKRKLSPETIAKISAAQRKRWKASRAKVKAA